MGLVGTPLQLGSRVVPNRLVMTPHLGRQSPGRFLAYLQARVQGGVGLVITPAGSPVYGASVYDDLVNYLPDGFDADLDAVTPGEVGESRAWKSASGFMAKQAEVVHSAGALIVGQIHHPGAERAWDSFQPTIAPSAVDGEWPAQHPHELTDAEIERLIRIYIRNASLIAAAGWDGVEVHAAHGYLLNRFLSPAYNRRAGRFGGSIAARWAMLAAILGGIRDVVGDRFVVGVRLPPFEEVAGGLSTGEVAEGLTSCLQFLDYVNLSVGVHDGLADAKPVLAYTTPWLATRPDLLPAAAAIKQASGLPVIVTGGFIRASQVQQALASGGADMVGLARALIADPDFPRKLMDGNGDDIVECIGCNECVLIPFACTVNPASGREAEFARPARAARLRVIVVGGGPAGLTAALTLAERDHDVRLYEREAVLGGRLRQLVGDPARARWQPLLDRLVRRATDQVEVVLGQRVDAAAVAAWAPDAVVVATGSRPAPPRFATDGTVEMLTSVDVLAGARPLRSGEVVVCGGTEAHLDPLMTARLLAASGYQVRLLSDLPVIGAAVEPRTLHHLLHELLAMGVETSRSTRVSHVSAGQVVTMNLFSGTTAALSPVALVLAHSRDADTALAQELSATPVRQYVIGDALAPRRLTHAVLEGARFGVSL